MVFKIGDNFSAKIAILLEAMYGNVSMGEVTVKHDGSNWHCKFVNGREDYENYDYDAYYKLTEDENAENGYRCQLLQVGGEEYEWGTGGDTNGEWINARVPWGVNPEETEYMTEVEIAYFYFDYWRSITTDGFTYDEEKQCYVNNDSIKFKGQPEDEDGSSGTTAEIQFKNGKVVRISLVEEIDYGDGDVYRIPHEITFFDYGTTTVTFPSES